MNKICTKLSIFFLVIGLSSCSYKPIFLEKSYDFEIVKINLEGEKKINRIIRNKLKLIRSNGDKDKNKYIINIKSYKKKEIVSKDTKGDPLKFEINILVEYEVVSDGNLLLSKKIENSNIYNNDTDQFKLEQTEDLILENLTASVSDNVISSIINLDDN